MDPMSSIVDAVEALRKLTSTTEQGNTFEKLMVHFIKADPTLSQEFDKVYRWSDWRSNGGTPDTGIDLLAHSAEDDTWTAIQCKF